MDIFLNVLLKALNGKKKTHPEAPICLLNIFPKK